MIVTQFLPLKGLIVDRPTRISIPANVTSSFSTSASRMNRTPSTFPTKVARNVGSDACAVCWIVIHFSIVWHFGVYCGLLDKMYKAFPFFALAGQPRSL